MGVRDGDLSLWITEESLCICVTGSMWVKCRAHWRIEQHDIVIVSEAAADPLFCRGILINMAKNILNIEAWRVMLIGPGHKEKQQKEGGLIN